MIESRIIGSIVTKNEADRYLEPCLKHSLTVLDEIFVYDDRSDDATVEIAKDLGCTVVVRPEDAPSFIQHEGRFRYGAWQAFEQEMNPGIGSWILSFDADEFIVAETPKETLASLTTEARRKGFVGIRLPFPEVFKVDEEGLWYRTDGFWGKIQGPRLFAYRKGGQWTNKPMGCGSEPLYVAQGPLSGQNKDLHVLHLGYAKDEDKEIKYKRYSELMDHGHNNSHIQSILQPPTLKLWEGPVPDLGDSFE